MMSLLGNGSSLINIALQFRNGTMLKGRREAGGKHRKLSFIKHFDKMSLDKKGWRLKVKGSTTLSIMTLGITVNKIRHSV
jgi:hypothetical protein